MLVDGLESREPFVELDDLRERGLVRMTERDVLFCDSFERQADGLFCDGWAAPYADGEPSACTTCGRLFDEEVPDTLYMLALEREALVLALTPPGARRLREGVAWSVEGERDDVLVVVADWSDGTRWMTNRTLMGRPFVLIQVDEAVTASRLGEEPWVVRVSLLDVLRVPSKLSDAIREAERLADVPRVGPAITELHRLRSLVVREVRGAHVVELLPGALRVDGVDVPLSPGMERVVEFLVDRHLEDVRDGKAPEDFCSWSLEEMAEALGLSRSSIRTQASRFQERLTNKYADEVLRPLPAGSVLQAEDAAWRLRGDCVVRRGLCLSPVTSRR